MPSSVYQRVINKMLGSLCFTIEIVFMNDTFPSRTVEEGLNNLETILKLFNKANLRLNSNKYNLLCKTNLVLRI